LLGALRSALASKFNDGKLVVVKAFDVKGPKTKQFRAALDALKVDSTALLVEEAKHENRNLELSSRNIDGLELVRGHEVHPYHLLRYDRVIFSQPAIEKLQASLVNSVSKRQRAAADGNGERKAARSPRKRARREKAAEVA
jgi:large subunit ribosomal protein L4